MSNSSAARCNLAHWSRVKMAAISQATIRGTVFFTEEVRISIKISLKFGIELIFSEPVTVSLLTQICVTRLNELSSQTQNAPTLHQSMCPCPCDSSGHFYSVYVNSFFDHMIYDMKFSNGSMLTLSFTLVDKCFRDMFISRMTGQYCNSKSSILISIYWDGN